MSGTPCVSFLPLSAVLPAAQRHLERDRVFGWDGWLSGVVGAGAWWAHNRPHHIPFREDVNCAACTDVRVVTVCPSAVLVCSHWQYVPQPHVPSCPHVYGTVADLLRGWLWVGAACRTRGSVQAAPWTYDKCSHSVCTDDMTDYSQTYCFSRPDAPEGDGNDR